MTFTLVESPLDTSLLSLGDKELAFLKEQTGIHDTEKLKLHICDIQTKAYQKFPYPCIRRFLFTRCGLLHLESCSELTADPIYRLQITRLPQYEHVLNIGKTFENPIYLDVGCCVCLIELSFTYTTKITEKDVKFGHDLRALVAAGYPNQWALGTDLESG